MAEAHPGLVLTTTASGTPDDDGQVPLHTSDRLAYLLLAPHDFHEPHAQGIHTEPAH